MVRKPEKAKLAAAELVIPGRLDATLHHYGGIRLDDLARCRTRHGDVAVGDLWRAFGVQLFMVGAFLRVEAHGLGALRDRFPLGNAGRDHRHVPSHQFDRSLYHAALFGLGELRSVFKLRCIANEHTITF